MRQLRAVVAKQSPALLGTILVLCIASTHLTHLRTASNPNLINDDVRGWLAANFVWPTPENLPADPQVEYYRAITPLGYKALYEGLGTFVDPSQLSRILPYPLLALFLWALARAGASLSGWPGAMGALVLALSCPSLLARMTGALPRSFAFPLLSLGLLAMVRGQPRLLAAVTVAASFLYPSAAMTLGLALTLWLLALPAGLRAVDWSARRRLAMVAGVAGLALIALLPLVVAGSSWGPRLAPSDEANYPELGQGGRYAVPDRAPRGLARDTVTAALDALRPQRGGALRWYGVQDSSDIPRAVGLLLLLAVGAWRLRSTPLARGPASRVATFAAASALAYSICWFSPSASFLPQRVSEYAVPTLLLLVLGAGPCLGLRREGGPPTFRTGLLAVATWVAVFGWGIAGDEGYTVRFKDRELFAAIRRAAPEALIAGFPDGPIEQVPYFTKRRAFYTRETHHVFHERYALEMRARLLDLSAGYFGPDPAALERLLYGHGIDLLIVDRHHFRAPPTYFSPYDRAIAADWARGAAEGFVLESLLPRGEIARDGRFSVVALARMLEASDSAGDEGSKAP